MATAVFLTSQSDSSHAAKRPRRIVVSRACDRCKVRKIKCSAVQPCRQCHDSAVACTYLMKQRVRGPRFSAQSRECDNISQVLSDTEEFPSHSIAVLESFRSSQLAVSRTPQKTRYRLPTHDLITQLQLFGSRLAAIWPIVDVASLITKLKQSNEVELRALSTAILAAMLSQLNYGIQLSERSYNADEAARECQYYYSQLSYNKTPNLNGIRIRFFLHAYYENIHAGCSESIQHLREAITMTQILGIHDTSHYIWLCEEEAYLRKALFWLLFITERGISVLHRLPVILHPSLTLPQTHPAVPQITQAFAKLVELVFMIDKAGLYVLMQGEHPNCQDYQSHKGLTDLNIELETLCPSFEGSTVAQRADIHATIYWIRSIIYHHLQDRHERQIQHLIDILRNADHLVSGLLSLPASALEANGFGIQLKIFNVAQSTLAAFSETPTEHMGPEIVLKLNKCLQGTYRLLSSRESSKNSLSSDLFNIVIETYSNIVLLSQRIPGQFGSDRLNAEAHSTCIADCGDSQRLHSTFEPSHENLERHRIFRDSLVEKEIIYTKDTEILELDPIFELSPLQQTGRDILELHHLDDFNDLTSWHEALPE